jgi:acyl-CoA thioesterase-1
MIHTPPSKDAVRAHGPSRRLILAALLAAPAGPVLARAAPVVTVLGDSITAGYGLPAASALPAQLQAELARRGRQVVVRGAGVSGDTTGGGLARLDFSVQDDTRVCVVALGGNDLLRGLDPKTTEANLTRIVSRLKARRMAVVLAAIRAPRAAGAGYAQAFDAAFAHVARTQGVTLAPDMLAGVAGVADLNQRDGIHPNARGAQIVARNLAPAVIRALG